MFGNNSIAQKLENTLDSLLNTSITNRQLIANPLLQKPNGTIGLYKQYISPIYISKCAFSPSCSQYAKGAFQKYGVLKATFLSTDRLTRCHPLALKYDYDYDHKRHLCIDHP